MIIYEDKVILQRVISGGQTGADQAGLYAAKVCGYETGGFAPQGYRTLVGNNPAILRDEFNLVETTQRNYQVRTAMNVKSSDATIRLATNFQSPGEICTLNAIRKYGKPFIDIDLRSQNSAKANIREAYINSKADEFIRFLIEHQVVTLNVAGNADQHPPDGFGLHFLEATDFLIHAFKKIKNDSLQSNSAPSLPAVLVSTFAK